MANQDDQNSKIKGRLNPRLRELRGKQTTINAADLTANLKAGNRSALSRAITLLESQRADHQEIARQVIAACLPVTKTTQRIGITGSPGVGKSTFIESLGLFLINRGLTVAVLAIDPSSQMTHGSILGDKTRMDQLARHPQAFVRPSPAGNVLGGVARATRESISLCEAAGYDVILIETVGVGQSETAVASMTDLMVLLLLPGAGDDLQGIKRGVVEMADLLVVNKSDGDRVTLAKTTKRAYANALHLFPLKETGWSPPVVTASALHAEGLEPMWQAVEQYFASGRSKKWLAAKRENQAVYWFEEAVLAQLAQLLSDQPAAEKQKKALLNAVQNQEISPFAAAEALLKTFKENV